MNVALTSVDGLGPALRVADVCVGEVEVSVGEDWQEQIEDGQEGHGEGGHGAPGAPPNHLHKIKGQQGEKNSEKTLCTSTKTKDAFAQ